MIDLHFSQWPLIVLASLLLNALAQHLIYVLATTLATPLFTAGPNPIQAKLNYYLPKMAIGHQERVG